MSNKPISQTEQTLDIVTFHLGRQRYGILVKHVVEILQIARITELPDLPPGMLGLINYRGKIIPLIDLRQVLDTPVHNFTLDTPVLVAGNQQGTLGMIVDNVDRVENFSMDMVKTEEQQIDQHHHIASVIKTNEELILMINLDILQNAYHYTD